jgi:hypothetical protein
MKFNTFLIQHFGLRKNNWGEGGYLILGRVGHGVATEDNLWVLKDDILEGVA